jgi:ubiquinone/menaquinone biosynthesis C-methylase UbiE
VSYDDIAEAYEQHWGPVIRPGAERILDLVAPRIDPALAHESTPQVLDVGTGTGALALRALERWPAIDVTGIDPSGGMLEIARRAADARLGTDRASRFRTAVGWADELPVEDASFDIAMSSFVLQLVPDRGRALREVRRVLRPGAIFAWVAWRRGDRPYEPDRIANEVLDEAGFDPPEAGGRNGDLASATAAAQAMRRAGFRAVRATEDEVAHAWTPAAYLAFLTEFDEATLFAELDRGERRDIQREILRRLRRLTPEQLTLRLPVVQVLGHVPD